MDNKLWIAENGEVYAPDYRGMLVSQGDADWMYRFKAYRPGPHGAVASFETLGNAIDWLIAGQDGKPIAVL